ncbi:MAG: fibronectin type III domain-containing protein [Planctomycetia bacterium]|nr:fibronectin type III domain-containing protein [Planctomycetia bacterium]
MKRTSFFRKGEKRNLFSRTRQLQLESLEQRQMLTASSLVDADFDSVNGTTYVVDTGNDVVDATDGLTSLREAVAAASDGDKITFAEGVDAVSLDKSLAYYGDALLTISGENTTIYCNDASSALTIAGFEMDGVRIVNNNVSSTTYLTAVSFTGDYTVEDNFDSVLANYGNMGLLNVRFAGVNISSVQEYGEESSYDGDELEEFICLNLIYNHGDLTLASVDMIENTFASETDRDDNSLGAVGIFNEEGATLYADGVLIANNLATTSTNRGDMVAAFVGIANLGETTTMKDIMVYGNYVELDALDERFGDEVLENSDGVVFSIFTSLRDMTLENATLLQGVNGYRGDFYLSNSIYLAEGNELERAMIVDVDDCNYVVDDLTTLNAIFPAFDTEEFTFTDYDHRMYLDSPLVDAGSIEVDPNAVPAQNNEVDLEGNPRLNGSRIDIGAVESNAQQLVVGNLQAEPAEGAEGLDTVHFQWDAVPNATGYNLQYKVGDGEWVLLENLSVDTLSYTLSGIDEGTECSFQIQAIGDNLSWIDSDWSDPASCVTKTQLQVPEDLEASLKTPNSIDVAWALVANAEGYTLQMRVKNSNENWTTIDAENFRLNTKIGASLQEELLYETTYEFRIKALGNDTQTIDSEWATVEATTGTTLAVVDLALESRGTDTITVTWNDTVNTDKPVKAYIVEYQAEGDNEWSRATVNGNQATVSGLDEGTQYHFRLMVEGTGDTSLSSDWSETLSAFTLQTLGTPVVEAMAESSSQIEVSWSAVENASGYVLTVMQGTNTVFSTTTTSLTATVSDLSADTLYTVIVTAKGTGEFVDSEPGTTECKTLIQLLPPVLTVTERTTNSVTVTWDAIENASGYEVQYKLTENGSWQTLTSDNENCTATFTESEDIPASQSVWFQIRALGKADVSQTSEWSSTISNDTLEILVLDAQALQADATGADSVLVTWDGVEGATSYTLTWSRGSERIGSVQVSSDAESYTVTGLESDTEYVFALVANGDGTTNVSSEPISTTATTWIQLLPPEIDLSERTENSLSGVLSQDTNASGYCVQYSTDKQTWQDATMNGNEFTVTNLEPGTLYYLRAMSLGIDGTSVDSDWSSENEYAEVYTQGVLATPEDFEVSVKGTTIIDVAWARVENAGKYLIEWQQDGDTEWATQEVSQSLDNIVVWNFTNLTPATTYHFKVKAISTSDDFVDSISTEIKSGTTNAVEQLASPVLTYDSLTSNSVVLQWNAVESADGYVVYFRQVGEESYESCDAGTNTTLTLDTLSPNRSYEAYVVAVTTNTEFSDSDASNTVSFTTAKLQLDTPVLSLSYTDDEQSIVATWNPIDGATGYTLNYRTQGGTWNSVDVDANTTSYTLSELAENTTYEFRVDALGDSDTNDASSDVETIATPSEVNLTAIVRKEATSEGTTAMPATETWIDEWTNAYVEIWTGDTDGVINGRSFSFTLTISDMYQVTAEEVSGFTLTNLGNGQYKVTVSDFTGGTGDTLLARFALQVTSANSVDWEDIGKSDAFTFNNENIATTVYAIPGDLDDNGVIEMGPDGNDTRMFDVEYGKTVSYADFDASQMVRNADRKWMMENNDGKSFEKVNAGLEAITYPEGFPYDFAPVEKLVGQADASVTLSWERTPVLATDLASMESSTGGIQLAYAVIEANEIPVVVDANALSSSLAAKDTELAEQTPNLVDEIFAALEDDLDFFA